VPAAITLTVNRTEDAVGAGSLTDGVCDSTLGPGQCTLRAAVMEANHYPGGGVTIALPAGAYPLTIAPSAALTETVGSLDLDAALTLTGAGAASTAIDGGGIDRVLCVRKGAAATISGVTLRNGRSTTVNGSAGNCGDFGHQGLGGGIWLLDNANLTLRGSVVRDNTAGSGGGILSGYGRLTLDATTVAWNTAESHGGGISNAGTLILLNSTVSNNSAGLDHGGIVTTDSPVTLVHSTIAGNVAVSGGAGTGSSGGLFQSTFGTATLRSTILADNFAGAVPKDCGGTIQSQGYNLIRTTTGCTVGTASPTDVAGDPLLEPLRDNGGGMPTRALLAGSPALDKIPLAQCIDPLAAPLMTDQRGAPRPQNGMCDIGAYEGRVPAGYYGRNLVRNGDAESSAGSPQLAFVGMPSWVALSGQRFTVIPYGVAGPFPNPANPGVPGAGTNLFAGGPVAGDTLGSQAVALAPIAAAVDGGRVRFSFSAYLGGRGSEEDRARALLVWFDGSGQILPGSAVLEGPTSAERGGASALLPRSASGAVPAGARSATIGLAMLFGTTGGAYNDAYADNVSIVLTPPPVIFLPALRR
jgi:hypothetical protein